MNKGAVAVLALVAMACISGPAIAAKKSVAPAKSAKVVMSDAELQAYRDGFKEATTAVDYQLFVDMFTGSDPDKLVPIAKAKIKQLNAEEAKAAAAEAKAAAAAPAAAPAAVASAPVASPAK